MCCWVCVIPFWTILPVLPEFSSIYIYIFPSVFLMGSQWVTE